MKFSQPKLDRLERKKKSSNDGMELLHVQTRSCQECSKVVENRCFSVIIQLVWSHSIMLSPITYNIDQKVHRCSLDLKDNVLLAKLAPGDMIAVEANTIAGVL